MKSTKFDFQQMLIIHQYVHVGTHISVLPLFTRLYALHTRDQLCEHRLVVHSEGRFGQCRVDLGEPVLVPLQQVGHSLGEDLLSRAQEILTVTEVSSVKK